MSPQVAEIFAKRVEQRLKELGNKSTDWLGARLGIAGSGVRKVLGENRAPRIDSLLKWAEALEVPAAWLLGEDGSAPRTVSPSREEMVLYVLKAFDLPEDKLAAIAAILNGEAAKSGSNEDLVKRIEELSLSDEEKEVLDLARVVGLQSTKRLLGLRARNEPIPEVKKYIDEQEEYILQLEKKLSDLRRQNLDLANRAKMESKKAR